MRSPIEKAIRADLVAMEAFAKNIRQMTPIEIKAAVKWMWERAAWEISYRQRWPWWELDS